MRVRAIHLLVVATVLLPAVASADTPVPESTADQLEALAQNADAQVLKVERTDRRDNLGNTPAQEQRQQVYRSLCDMLTACALQSRRLAVSSRRLEDDQRGGADAATITADAHLLGQDLDEAIRSIAVLAARHSYEYWLCDDVPECITDRLERQRSLTFYTIWRMSRLEPALWTAQHDAGGTGLGNSAEETRLEWLAGEMTARAEQAAAAARTDSAGPATVQQLRAQAYRNLCDALNACALSSNQLATGYRKLVEDDAYGASAATAIADAQALYREIAKNRGRGEIATLRHQLGADLKACGYLQGCWTPALEEQAHRAGALLLNFEQQENGLDLSIRGLLPAPTVVPTQSDSPPEQ